MATSLPRTELLRLQSEDLLSGKSSKQRVEMVQVEHRERLALDGVTLLTAGVTVNLWDANDIPARTPR